MSAYRRIDAAEAKALVQREGVHVLDTRDAAAFAQSHIENALNIGEADVGRLIAEVPKTAPLIIYCYKGNASRLYAAMFAGAGFAEVYSLDGGYDAWRALEALSAIDAEGDVNAQDAAGMTLLMHAAHSGTPDQVASLLRAGARVDIANRDGNQALWLACVGDDPAIVDLIIAAGADLEHRNATGATALMYSASAGKNHALTRLLAAGADLTVEADGLTAMDMAADETCLNLLMTARRARRASNQQGRAS